MAYGNWDEIVAGYQKIYLAIPRSSVHAQAMVELIPLLREDSAFDDCIPLTSHGTLCLKLSKQSSEVCVWGLGNDHFEIYIYNPAINIDSEKIVVSTDSIRETLLRYLRKTQVSD